MQTRVGNHPNKKIIEAIFSVEKLLIREQDAPTTFALREYAHPQWGNVLHFQNNEIEAVLAPERGCRLTHYSRVGQPNLLWIARDIQSGQGNLNGWRNWGGEKTWLWPEAHWPELANGKSWPPPLDFDQNRFERDLVTERRFSNLRRGATTEHASQVGKPTLRYLLVFHSPLGLTRAFLFPNTGTEIKIAMVLDTGRMNVPRSVWSVIQIPTPDFIGLERVAPFRFLPSIPELKNPLVLRDEKTLDLTATRDAKGMVDATGFRVATKQGTLVARQSGIDESHLPYEDIYQAQVYVSPVVDGDAYVELEFAAPLPSKPAVSRQCVAISLE